MVAEAGRLERLGRLGLVERDLGAEQLDFEGVDKDLLGGLYDFGVDAFTWLAT